MQKFTDFVFLLRNSSLWKLLLLRKPISVSSFGNLNKVVKYTNNFNTIIDVGANVGQFAFAAKYYFPKSNLFCFEPSAKIFKKLKKNLIGISDVNIFNYGLGDIDGELDFHEYTYDQISSFQKIYEGNRNPIYCDANDKITKSRIKKLN